MADVLHTAVMVSDLDATKAFYQDILGLEHSRDSVIDGEENYFVTGENRAELQFKYDPDVDVSGEASHLAHLAVAVDDVDAVVERAVEEAGSEVVREPWTDEETDRRIAFVTDPTGYTVELIQHL